LHVLAPWPFWRGFSASAELPDRLLHPSQRRMVLKSLEIVASFLRELRRFVRIFNFLE
jgi:hypothetical protein